MQPFARKKWVKRQTDPINDRLNELDQLNAKNAKDIQDVDARAQAGIKQAQSTADAANQAATQAGAQAQQANTIAQGASGHVDQINTTVNGIDQYRQMSEMDIPFNGVTADPFQGRPGPARSACLQREWPSGLRRLKWKRTRPDAGRWASRTPSGWPRRSTAISWNTTFPSTACTRWRWATLPWRTLPWMRTQPGRQVMPRPGATGDQDDKPVRTRTVHIRLMENSLAAQGSAPPQGVGSSTGAERP